MLPNLSGVQNFNTNFISTFFPPSTHLFLSHSVSGFVSVSRFVFLQWAKIYGGAKVKIAKRFQQKAKIQNEKKGDDTKRQAGQKEEGRGRREEEKQRKQMSKKKTARRRFV